MSTFYRFTMMCLLVILAQVLNAQFPEIGIVEKNHASTDAFTRFADTQKDGKLKIKAIDPEIAAMVSSINEDTLRATILELQSLGSRFLMNDNKREIAMSLADKFKSYGYADVRLDSFYLIIPNWNGLSDSSWQYNVVCTLEGSSAPHEIYVIGGHWDSICLPDPVNDAPGADDNGSAVAATLEIARTFKKFNYKPEATIQFTLFAAEELGLFGSRSAAYYGREQGTDIRYMLNMDMISNNPDNLPEVKLYQYLGCEWAGLVAADAIERYTGLSVTFPANHTNSGSDSYSYWAYGFPTIYFEEIVFSPNWHHPSDSIENCNIPYLKSVTGGALATLMEQQSLPYPQNVSARSSNEDIILTWKKSLNANIKGTNIYRTTIKGSGYQKINTLPVTDSVYHDIPGEINKQYYYVVSTVNNDMEESFYSAEVTGARFHFCDTLLVLANVKGNKITPDSVRSFYQTALDTIPYKWMDLNAEQKIDLNILSRYRSIFWMTNTLEFEPLTDEMMQEVAAFLSNGGNLLYAGFSPGRFWINGSFTYPLAIPDYLYLHQWFKADSVDRKQQAMLCAAYPVTDEYNHLRIDSLKNMNASFQGQIFNIEVFSPDSTGRVIYRFDSRYDSTTSFGRMKHRPVGLEYLGGDFKTILLSFPLYYLDKADAKEFLHLVMTEKFNSTVGIQDTGNHSDKTLHVYPNPVRDVCYAEAKLNQPGLCKISLVSIRGKIMDTRDIYISEPGKFTWAIRTSSLQKGVYEVLLMQGNEHMVKKIIRVD